MSLPSAADATDHDPPRTVADMTGIRAVVTDLDGTFWHGHEVIHPRIRAAWDELTDAGIHLLIATGRRRRSVLRGTEPAGLVASAVLMSGALGVDLASGHEWHRTGFSPQAAAAVLAAFRAEGVEPVAYIGTDGLDVIAAEDCATNPGHLASFGPHVRRHAPDDAGADGLLVGFGVLGVPDVRLDRVRDSLEGTAACWYGPNDHLYGGETLMVGPAGVSKVDGIRIWCEEQGIHASELLAVGDGTNDLEMLAWAGTSVAVRGGATEAAGADHVIEGPESAGWATILDLL